VARESFQFGPQSPNLPIFGLIFDENNIATLFWPTMKFELCIPGLEYTLKLDLTQNTVENVKVKNI